MDFFKKKNVGNEAETQSKDLREKLEKVEEVKTREVKVYYKSCCGCGCDTTWLYRDVPIDSPLRNGDRVHSLERGDRRI